MVRGTSAVPAFQLQTLFCLRFISPFINSALLSSTPSSDIERLLPVISASMPVVSVLLPAGYNHCTTDEHELRRRAVRRPAVNLTPTELRLATPLVAARLTLWSTSGRATFMRLSDPVGYPDSITCAVVFRRLQRVYPHTYTHGSQALLKGDMPHMGARSRAHTRTHHMVLITWVQISS